MKKACVYGVLAAVMVLVVVACDTASTTGTTTTYPLYVANYDAGTLSAYSIGTGGALTALTTATYATGSEPVGIAICPTEK